jgi:hypothetical protein
MRHSLLTSPLLLLMLTACGGSSEGTNPGECTDGADNDGNGLFDCADPGCYMSPDCEDSDDTSSDGGEEEGGEEEGGEEEGGEEEGGEEEGGPGEEGGEEEGGPGEEGGEEEGGPGEEGGEEEGGPGGEEEGGDEAGPGGEEEGGDEAGPGGEEEGSDEAGPGGEEEGGEASGEETGGIDTSVAPDTGTPSSGSFDGTYCGDTYIDGSHPTYGSDTCYGSVEVYVTGGEVEILAETCSWAGSFGALGGDTTYSATGYIDTYTGTMMGTTTEGIEAYESGTGAAWDALNDGTYITDGASSGYIEADLDGDGYNDVEAEVFFDAEKSSSGSCP